MDPWNVTNRTYMFLSVPQHIWQDYVQIGFLLILVVVGVPLNTFSFIKTLLLSRNCNKESKCCHMVTLKLHLAIIDLLILFLYAVSRAVWFATLKWMAGDLFCKLSKFCQTFALCCNSYLVAVIAVDRLCTVANVQKKQDRRSGIKFQRMIKVSYLLAILFSLPQLYVWETISPFTRDPSWAQCVTIWVADKISANLRNITLMQSYFEVEKFYSFYHMVFTFYIPFIIVAISYVLVWVKFRRSISEARGDILLEHRRRTSSTATSMKRHSRTSSKKSNGEEDIHVYRMMELMVVLRAPKMLEDREFPIPSYSLSTLLKAKNKAVKKCAYVIAAYIILWCPYNILSLITFVNPRLISATSLWRILYDLIVVNAVVNPFLYGL